ncbi:MAG: M23 family metallopeptidase [Proteobacteria bacterium]|nr:M23 family metallopeptidase [Pseudomonadota bacterium]MBS0571960.1 M23 family metallopeptidase [Pseudomonadota bacterium]
MKSDRGTRFVRLGPWTQALVLGGTAVFVAWSLLATGILMIGAIGSGDAREQARQSMIAFEGRLDSLSKERDLRAAEAAAAQARFSVALGQVSQMQSALLASEQRRRELETGIGLIQETLHTAMKERDASRLQVARLSGGTAHSAAPDAAAVGETLSLVTAELGETARERDGMQTEVAKARAEADDTTFQMKLLEQRHDQIFSQLEDAVTISVEPLDQVFTSVGIDPKTLLAQVKRGYSGQGGPWEPLVPASLPGGDTPQAQADAARAAKILEGLDNLNLYRIAIEKTPLAMPIKSSFRFTSGFGQRWSRLHAGIDLAGAYGTPIYATADGVVTHAGWENGYGNMVEITHPYGIKTRFGHLSAVKVSVGEKVSRGDRIGDMGSTGRSTGTHLHYEVRIGGEPVNPLSFIKAAANVF